MAALSLASVANAPTKAIIWEPNVDAHSSIVQNSVSQDYDIDVTGASVAYFGVNQPIATETNLKSIVKNGASPYTTAMTPDIMTLENNTAYNEIFTLEEGVPWHTPSLIYPLLCSGQDGEG